MTSLKARYWQTFASSRVANAMLFNLSWFAILVTQSSIIAPVIVVLHLLAHFRFMDKRRGELVLVVGVTVCGAVIDQALFLTGVFKLAGQIAPAPLWMTCLWPVFATTLMHAFDGFQHRLVLAALFGAVGGPLSYLAGVGLTSVAFASPLWGPVIVGVLWASVFPLMLTFSARLNRDRDALQSWEPPVRQALD